MEKIEGIVYDLDGLLADSLPVHTSARLAAFESVGLSGVDQAIHDQAHEHGMTPNEIIGWVLQQVGAVAPDVDLRTDSFVNEVVALKRQAFHDLAAEGLPAVDGALDCIEFAVKRWGRLAIATTGEYAIDVLPYIRRHNLEGVFMAIVTKDDTPEGMTKPHKFPFQEAAARLGFVANQGGIIGIDDHPSGIVSANAAGLYSVGLTTTHAAEQLGESRLVLPGHAAFIAHFS